MSDMIKDGTGQCHYAKVDSTNRLSTTAITTSTQNYVSRINKNSFQVWGTASINTSEVPVLFLKNTSTTKDIVITYIRVMSVSAAATNENAYFSIKLAGSYISGGDAVTPVNMFASSALTASAEAYQGTTALSISSTFKEIDRSYDSNSQVVYRKDGSIILTTSDAIAITHTGSTVAGTAYARISFYYIDQGD